MKRLLLFPASSRIAKSVVLVLGLVVALGIGGGFGNRFEDAQENETSSFLPGGAESIKALEKIEQFRGGEIAPAIVVYHRGSGLTDADRRRIAADRDKLDANRERDVLPAGRPEFAPDGRTALIVQPVQSSGDGDRFSDAVQSIRDRTRSEVAAADQGGLAVKVTGAAGYGLDAIKIFEQINGVLLITTALVVMVLLILIYRSPVFWLLPFAAVASAEITARGAGYLLAEAGVTINGQSGGILPVLVFGAGTDYALLLVSRYREELRRNDDIYVAMRAALKSAGPAIFASGMTVIAALLTLTLAEVNGTAGLGPISAFGVGLAMVSMLTVLPALLLACGRRAFWPIVPDGPAEVRKPKVLLARRIAMMILLGLAGAGIGAAAAGVAGVLAGPVLAALTWFALAPGWAWLDRRFLFPFERRMSAGRRGADVDRGLWRRVGERVARSPRRVWIGAAALLVALCFGNLALDTSLTNSNSFRGEVEAVEGQELLAAAFPAGASAPTTVIVPDPSKAEAVAEALRGREDLVASVSPPENGPPGVKFEVILKRDALAAGTFDMVPSLRRTVKDAGGRDVLVGGATAEGYDYREAATRDNFVILPLALLVVFLILAALLRALIAPLILLGTVILSFGAAIGTGILFFRYVFDFPGEDPSLPLLAFVFLVALGIDYNIFLMARVREEAVQHGTREGILRGLAVTGTVITSAGIVLAATFSALGSLPLIFLTEIGFIIAFGVLLDTFLVRSILVPAISLDIGRRIWWPSALARKPDPVAAEAATEPPVRVT